MTAKENRPSEAEAAPKTFGGVTDNDTPTGYAVSIEVLPLNQLIEEATTAYLASLDPLSPPPPAEVERDLLVATNALIAQANMGRPRVSQFRILQQLTFWQVARVLVALRHVVNIAPSLSSDRDRDVLAVYCASGAREGIYLTSETDIRAVAREYDHLMTTAAAREVMAILREDAPRVVVNADRDLVPMSNGIFNYSTKKLSPFSPEYIFLAKAAVPLDPSATSPVIRTPDGDDFEFLHWLVDMLDGDRELAMVVLQVIGALLRPYVRWNKAAWFFSEQGNNGKGTLAELMRNLLGEQGYHSLPLADMGKDFMLEPLTRANAIIVDENDVGQYIDRAANLKAIITNDVLMINRKNKAAISYRFWGFMVQCLNEFPRVKDRSESLYRRQLFVPFTKCFTGRERRYIKDEYMGRADVLAFVAKYVLIDLPQYYELDEPEASRRVLAEYKEFNDPVRAFWSEHSDRFAWDLLPFPFLYEMYLAWFQRTNPSGSPIGRNVFVSNLKAVVQGSEQWEAVDKTRSAGRMDAPEHLIAEYDMESWMNPVYRVKGVRDLDKLCKPALAASYRGIARTASAFDAGEEVN